MHCLSLVYSVDFSTGRKEIFLTTKDWQWCTVIINVCSRKVLKYIPYWSSLRLRRLEDCFLVIFPPKSFKISFFLSSRQLHSCMYFAFVISLRRNFLQYSPKELTGEKLEHIPFSCGTIQFTDEICLFWVKLLQIKIHGNRKVGFVKSYF